jgi:antitoxin component YwqK of YwqJK toxin-antitoxin module
MKNKIRSLLSFLFILFFFQGNSQITKELRNLIWSNNDKYVVYGHAIQPIFGDISYTNKFNYSPRTNIAYKNLPQLINDLKIKAETEKWDNAKLNEEITKLEKNAKGGRVYLYLDRISLDNANLRYFFAIVRDMDPKKEKELFITYFKQNEPYISAGDRFASEVEFDINKELPDSFYVYINDNQTEAMSDYKFKVSPMPKSEKIVTYYPDNKVNVEGMLEYGLQTGKWVKYHPNGKLNIVEYYKEGKLDGKSMEYADDGSLRAENEFKNGLKHGVWKLYKQKIITDGRYKDNKKDSIWKYYDTIGNIKAAGTYMNDLKNGSWTFYDNNRKESEGNYTDNAENGEWKLFDTLGNVIAKGMIKYGKEEKGTWSYFSADGKTIAPDTTVLLVADKMPQFRDGNFGMMMFIKENANFPPASMDNLNGKVFLSIVVEPNGSLSNITLLKGLKPEIDAELLRVFSFMPRWIPGFQGGNLARVKMIMPVKIGG